MSLESKLSRISAESANPTEIDVSTIHTSLQQPLSRTMDVMREQAERMDTFLSKKRDVFLEKEESAADNERWKQYRQAAGEAFVDEIVKPYLQEQVNGSTRARTLQNKKATWYNLRSTYAQRLHADFVSLCETASCAPTVTDVLQLVVKDQNEDLHPTERREITIEYPLSEVEQSIKHDDPFLPASIDQQDMNGATDASTHRFPDDGTIQYFIEQQPQDIVNNVHEALSDRYGSREEVRQRLQDRRLVLGTKNMTELNSTPYQFVETRLKRSLSEGRKLGRAAFAQRDDLPFDSLGMRIVGDYEGVLGAFLRTKAMSEQFSYETWNDNHPEPQGVHAHTPDEKRPAETYQQIQEYVFGDGDHPQGIEDAVDIWSRSYEAFEEDLENKRKAFLEGHPDISGKDLMHGFKLHVHIPMKTPNQANTGNDWENVPVEVQLMTPDAYKIAEDGASYDLQYEDIPSQFQGADVVPPAHEHYKGRIAQRRSFKEKEAGVKKAIDYFAQYTFGGLNQRRIFSRRE